MKNANITKIYLCFILFLLLNANVIAQSDTSIRIQQIFLNNKPKPFNKDSDLTVLPDRRNIRIELSPPVLSNPASNGVMSPLSIKDSFVFYLQGSSIDTIKTAYPTIQFTNLSGNHYILSIALLRGGHKYAPTLLGIDVKKKLIEQDWFQIALLLSGILIIAGFSFLAVQYNYRQKMRDQNLRLKLAADLHERIGALLTSINVWAKVLKRDLSTALSVDNGEVLNKIIHTSKEVADKMRETIWLTNPDNDLMDKLFERMSATSNQMLMPQTQVTFDYLPEDVEDMKISMSQREDVFMMFTEIINNIRKHAEAANVEVHITREQHFVRLLVQDNGKGFDVVAAYEGYGLKSLRWRAQRSFIKLTIESTIGKGTTVTMIIPEL
jgi:signal transduction histidine kinase